MSWSLTKLSVLEHVRQALSSLCFRSWLLPASKSSPVLPHNPQGSHGSIGPVLVPLPRPLPAACTCFPLNVQGSFLPLSLGYLLGLASSERESLSVALTAPYAPGPQTGPRGSKTLWRMCLRWWLGPIPYLLLQPLPFPHSGYHRPSVLQMANREVIKSSILPQSHKETGQRGYTRES